MPPALVERLPPIWQVPSAARLSGSNRSDLGRRLLRHAQHAARLDDHGVVDGVDVADPVQPPQGDQHVGPFGARNLPAHQARVAALRNDAHLGFGADAHDVGDFARVCGLEQQRRLAHEAVAPFGQVRGKLVRIVGKPGWAEYFLQPSQGGGGGLPRHGQTLAVRGESLHGVLGVVTFSVDAEVRPEHKIAPGHGVVQGRRTAPQKSALSAHA